MKGLKSFKTNTALINKKLPQSMIKNQRATFFDRIKGYLDRELQVEPYEKSRALIDTNLTMYTEMRQFQAYLTKNAFDMSIFNEFDVWPHTNFGTIDNPLIIFGAGTTWRMVMCSGPGSEEESSSHEKMMFIVREGPIHRCIMCGQCFKLLKLKDEVASEENMYYSSVFTQISDRVVGDIEDFPLLNYNFTMSDVRNWNRNIMPTNRAFVFVNADESDHIMVDPAFRLQFYNDSLVDLKKKEIVKYEIARQAELAGLNKGNKITMEKDVFETWVKIERDILHFDRLYNRFVRFEGRKLYDPENHERRERRMLDRQRERLVSNYTYYYGGLTEKEQMYRDYYESDLEDFPEDTLLDEKMDNAKLAATGDFNLNNYHFLEENTDVQRRAPADSFVEKLLFRHRYRQVSDGPQYERRVQRVTERSLRRAENRDPRVVQDLGDKLEELYVRKGLFENITGKEDELLPFAGYIAEEGFAQFKDYYETDIEQGEINKDLLEDLSERDRIAFSECFVNDFNKSVELDKSYVMIPKRPFNNKKSVVANFIDDLIDFNYRVKPLARNLVFRDVSSKFQPLPLNDNELAISNEDNSRYKKVLDLKRTSKNKQLH